MDHRQNPSYALGDTQALLPSLPCIMPLSQVAPKFQGRRSAHWSPPPVAWSMDLSVRPPTPALDLLTDYLEVKYRCLGGHGWRGFRAGAVRAGPEPRRGQRMFTPLLA